MVPRRLYTWNVALLILLGLHAPAANAAPIDFTGNVTSDFDPSTNPGVVVTPVSNNPLNIGQASWITANGWVSGWSIQDIRTSYDSSNDTLYVGINTFKNSQGVNAPFGQANGDPTGTPTSYDPAHLGGDKSIALVIAPVNSTNPNQPGAPVVVAGVPADKTVAGTGIDGYTVSSYDATKAANGGLAYAFGTSLPQHMGNLAYDPSPKFPQLEFTITNFSKIPGLKPSNGFWIEAYAGSALDGVAGEAYLSWTKVPVTAAQVIPNSNPEPTTWLAWTLVIGAAACRFRGRIRAQS